MKTLVTKRKFAVLLAALVILALLAGCSPAVPPQETASPSDSNPDDLTPQTHEPPSSPTAAPVEDPGEDAPLSPEEPSEPEPAPAPPEQKPDEPEKTSEPGETNKSAVCTVSIRCERAVESDALDDAVRELLPQDGILLHASEIPLEQGDTVFSVLKRVTRQEKIHLEFTDSPLYQTAYIEGIGNLYEFDCGERSGWMYRVDGVFPSVGCSSFALTGGETVEWVYTCDLGRDVGAGEGGALS